MDPLDLNKQTAADLKETMLRREDTGKIFFSKQCRPQGDKTLSHKWPSSDQIWQWKFLHLFPSIDVFFILKPPWTVGFPCHVWFPEGCPGPRWGFRLNSLPDLQGMSERIPIFEADFQNGDRPLGWFGWWTCHQLQFHSKNRRFTQGHRFL